jgi:putative heme-binding domain-containing protein
LAKLTTKLTPEQLVESILRPSKLIDKDFAQVSVLDVNGKVHTGIRISENDREIALRNLAEPEPIKIKRDDIEEALDSNVSLMPENLAKQLKSRKDFDDLMKYIIEIRKQ